ncbi:membrane-associated, eicosanoid/glutathione metabolism protein [Massariosphaeria phaeospora]|uniref:Membrane-associated, eicosanoid/glutathione metabolism protein n=1 Tax=Massariosphaeria phaeospora TaxID=100035 RepID=A0A7C8M9G3_9PLEO|nr:membrane-associated, eicosanoid/glutathione metabolism protein [Massariosphaeria phaeospora]
MTTRLGLGLGVPVPLLAPATATWAAPFAAYYLFLQGRIVYHRLTTKTGLGHQIDAANGNTDPLYIANRCQVNFVENVPIALIIALLAELNGANRTYINTGLGVLFALRVSHAELGLTIQNGLGLGRLVGFYGTQAFIAGFASYAAYLVKDYWLA